MRPPFSAVMYLKEIVISGFKSFADRTRLELRRGVTAVVGPNSCGKSNMVAAIDQINQTSQPIFQGTFEQVGQNFAFTYEKISGGDSSDLIGLDTVDPLESGIDITAAAAGTRLKSVTVRSGGQRTMAAVALLFAIYRVKLSPFCVLDEIDAALYAANVGGFCDILHGFTNKSQFFYCDS